MNTISNNSQVVRERGIEIIVLNNKYYCLTKNSNYLIELNETGYKIWKYIKNKIFFKDLLLKIMSEYDIQDKNIVSKDIKIYLKTLLKYQLVKILSEK
jgi:hypothetical protein